MATKHKSAANGVVLETTISPLDLRAICAKAAAESGPYRLVEKQNSDRRILYSLQGAFRGLVDLMTFSVTFGQNGSRNTLATEIETFTTSQTTVMLIPVTSKKMVGHETYMQFAKKIAASVQQMDPSAQVAVSDGEGARPHLAAPEVPPPPPRAPVLAATPAFAAAPLLPPPPPPSAAPPAPSPPPSTAAPSNPFLILSQSAAAGPAAAAEPAPAPPPPAPPAPAPAAYPAAEDDDVDRTQMSPRRRSEGALTVVLEDGQRIPLRGAILIGREPSERSEWPDARLVTVPDATKSVSKTHALLEVDPSGLWITDLASTNGVYVEQPDGPELDLEPGIRTAVAPGSDVSLGQYLFTVEKG